MLRFVVIADSHIRPPDQETVAYPSNALLVRRNEVVVDLCNEIAPAFVVHLGDIVHPLPVEATHHLALELAGAVYGNLDVPIHFVAGNHDVGDKPNAHVAVPSVADENYGPFESSWGPAYSSFDQETCHFVTIDAQAMNSGLLRETEQRVWLESDLSNAHGSGKRIFLFTHYPPFVRDPGENEHYDNLGEPARSWFLSLLETYNVEAVFSGHVHNFLFNTFGTTDMYVAPSTGFVRPDYAELSAVSPLGENGRDDPAKLGVFVVDITDDGHIVRPVRSFGRTSRPPSLPVDLPSFLEPAWSNPVGVTLSHSWMSVVDFPTAGLDEFARKRIRNDATLLALWEARITNVAIPLDDLKTADVSERVVALSERGIRFTVFSAGVPTADDIAVILDSGCLADWQISAFPAEFGAVVETVASNEIGVPLSFAPIVPVGHAGASVHHFVSVGFDPGNPELVRDFSERDPDSIFRSFVFRIRHGSDLEAGASMAAEISASVDRVPVCLVELPRAGESEVFDDDDAVAGRVREVARLGVSRPDWKFVLDGFMDHDRGYYPRHGLIDRRFNPRPAFYELISGVSRGRR
ncbi:MAG: metallophosphoesterase [Acidimicrobiia bacterium]